MRRIVRLLFPALVAGLVLAAGTAAACPICFSGRSVSLGQKIDAADAVVLATPLGESAPYRVIADIKGSIPVGTLVIDAMAPSPAFLAPGRPLLITRNKSSQQWSVLGSIGEGQAGWLRAFAAAGPAVGGTAKTAWPRTVDATSDLTEADWIARLSLVAASLESPDRLLAEIAYGEIARAPYRLLRSLEGARDPAEVLAWLDDGELIARQPAYTLLLGIVGGAKEAGAIRARIDARRAAHDATDLAALIAADLEIEGLSRVAYIEEAFLADKARTLGEIEAALLALSVHGAADAAIPRARVVKAYRTFIAARPPMAAFVVPDLADWQEYDAASDIEAAMTSGAIRDPASRYAVLAYLRRERTGAAASNQGTGSDLPP